MGLISDGLLLAAALTAAIYCHVLAGRLRKLRNLDDGVGQAIAALVSQVEEMRTALKAARAASGDSVRTLAERTARAEMAAGRLELLLAALHDREGSSAPMDVAARRAEKRRESGFAPIRSRGGTDGGGATALRAEPFRLETRADPLEDEEGERAPAAPEAAVEPAAPTPPAPERLERRLFRIELEPEGDAAEGAIQRLPSKSRKTAAERPEADAAALRTALEALARETSE